MSGARKCPICENPVSERFRPFCSRRCADLDLGRWLKGSYGIPAQEDDEETAPPEPDQTKAKN